jgi:hypothetical protein
MYLNNSILVFYVNILKYCKNITFDSNWTLEHKRLGMLAYKWLMPI